MVCRDESVPKNQYCRHLKYETTVDDSRKAQMWIDVMSKTGGWLRLPRSSPAASN